VIGYVGDSGNAEWTGSHTHFELRINDRAVDPFDLLVVAWERDYDLVYGGPWRLTTQALLVTVR
jgi:murein DD-endopeptidase MepM/ murein hydrolase activator NlpD